MSLNDKVKEKIKNYLGISEPHGLSINIEQLLDFEAEIFKNKLWVRGEANELEAFYKSLDGSRGGNRHFWGSQSTNGSKIRKIHTGLPGLIVKKLTDICTDDFLGVKTSDRQEDWDSIAKDNNFKKLLAKCVYNVLSLGDGAFKFSYDTEISKYPIIEFFPADRVDFEYERDRLQAVIFKTEKTFGKKKYTLKERYTKKSITYSLEDSEGKEIDLTAFPELSALQPIENKAEFIPAVPVMFDESKKQNGRGESIFSGKYDIFDSFDEVVSQWMLALRKGQIKEYIPEALIPRDPETGMLLTYNNFDNDFITLETAMSEGVQTKIETTQGTIQHEALLASYITILDLCLQGIISPSTLGIDVKKLDNADAQREKEKTTLYTRNKVIDTLDGVIQDVVITALKFYDNIRGQSTPADIDVTVSFGGYANPSFEAQVETIGKAAQFGIMSTEAAVDELYGDDKKEDWKKEEVKRIKAEKGILEAEEPAINKEVIV